MRRLTPILLSFCLAGFLLSGCGGASGIEEGIPKDTSPPPNFDPGGDAKPDMTGKGAPKS
ncbi:MAG: hypothetical protein U0794_13530 [Isosphaeraceae bacterium]